MAGQGRDMGFTAVTGFETKISAGNALQCTSRDLYRLGKHLDLARLFSFFFSGSGFYLTTLMTIQVSAAAGAAFRFPDRMCATSCSQALTACSDRVCGCAAGGVLLCPEGDACAAVRQAV